MNNNLIKTTQMIKGSVADVATIEGRELVDVVADIEAIVVLDVSHSMNTYDAPNGDTRFNYALDRLAEIQNRYPGKIALLCFNDHVTFCPNGRPPMHEGDLSTDMTAALMELLIADEIPSIVKFLISDGEPNDSSSALHAARQFKYSKIDTIFVGPELGYGADFLKQLSQMTGGTFSMNPSGMFLAETITKLLEAK